MAGQERIKIMDRRAVIAVFHPPDGPVVTLVGQALDDDRPQPQPQYQEQGEREDQAHDERGGYDALAAGSQRPLVLQRAKPAPQGARLTGGLLLRWRRDGQSTDGLRLRWRRDGRLDCMPSLA